MITIFAAVKEELLTSSIALESMRSGILNLRAFARQIHKNVETRTFKEVKIGTIVVALSRISLDLQDVESLIPIVNLDEITVKSPLIDVAYEKTNENLSLMHKFSKKLEKSEGHFFTATQGINEITFIISEDLKELLLSHYKFPPKVVITDLVGIDVRFNDGYIEQPNVIYAILHRLAIRRVNVLEIVSTYTELTVIVSRNEMEVAIKELNVLFK